MKRLAVLAIVLSVSVSLAQAQGRGARGGSRRGGHVPAAVQATQNTNSAQGAADTVQRPFRQRLRDPNICHASGGRPLRQRLRDPANCPRIGAASRGNQPGLGWGCMRGGGGRVGGDRPCCRCCNCRRGQGGWQRGWDR